MIICLSIYSSFSPLLFFVSIILFILATSFPFLDHSDNLEDPVN